MPRDWKASVKRFLHRDLLSGRVMPRKVAKASVDPNLFPEEQFPLYCPKCGYLLRGLPNDRCPECGTRFERGRLLVEQYVLRHGGPRLRLTRMGRWIARLVICGFLVHYVGRGALYVTVRWMKTQDTPAKLSAASETLFTVGKWTQVASGLALFLWFAAGILFAVRIWRNASKRRRILDALQDAEE